MATPKKAMTRKRAPAKDKHKYPALGRPSLYKREYADMLIDHFDVEPGEWKEITLRDGSTKSVWRANPLPTLAGFCRKLLICRKTLYNWAYETDEQGNPKNPEFL